MDSRFDLKEIWKDPEKRKKIVAVFTLILLSVLFLCFYYKADSKLEAVDELTEIPMTQAIEVSQYNDKLQALNDTIKPVDSFQKDLDNFFSGETVAQNPYEDEQRKADSLSKVFLQENHSSRLNQRVYGNTITHRNTAADRVTAGENRTIIVSSKPENIPLETMHEHIDKQQEEDLLLARKREALKASGALQQKANGGNYSVAIRGTQYKKSNQSLRIACLQDIVFEGITIPKNTYMYARLSFNNNRAYGHISSVNVRGKIIAVDMQLYSLDGNKGIRIDNASIEQTKDVMDSELSNTINSAGRVGRLMNAIGTSLKPAKETEVTFIDNQSLILLIE